MTSTSTGALSGRADADRGAGVMPYSPSTSPITRRPVDHLRLRGEPLGTVQKPTT